MAADEDACALPLRPLELLRGAVPHSPTAEGLAAAQTRLQLLGLGRVGYVVYVRPCEFVRVGSVVSVRPCQFGRVGSPCRFGRIG